MHSCRPILGIYIYKEINTIERKRGRGRGRGRARESERETFQNISLKLKRTWKETEGEKEREMMRGREINEEGEAKQKSTMKEHRK